MAGLRTTFRRLRYGLSTYRPGKFFAGLVIAVVLAVGQGLFELHQGPRVSTIWIVAVVVTVAGILATSEVIWNWIAGPRVNEAALNAALKMAVRSCDLGEDANVRACVYIAYRDKTGNVATLYQESPYVYAHGEGDDYAWLGRKGLSESVGIVGHVFRMGKECMYTSGDNTSAEAFIKWLMGAPWNFPRIQAERINKERASYMAFSFMCPPTLSRKKIEGVLYFDARGRDRFSDEVMARFLRGQRDVVVEFIAASF